MSKRNLYLFVIAIATMLAGVLVITITAYTEGSHQNDDFERVIVEMEEAPVTSFISQKGLQFEANPSQIRQHKKGLLQKQDEVLATLNDHSIRTDNAHHYTFTFNGMALEVPENKKAALLDVPGVKNVYPDTEVRIELDNSVPFIGAPEVWEMHDQDGSDITGEGMTVAVIDTGVDYTHPDLGEGFGTDEKVIGGYDFVHNDNDPMDDNGHGTHVAGIIAANGQLKGVAPDASIMAYKVVDEKGYGQVSDIIAAVDAAADTENPNRADVINMSLGVPEDESVPLALAAENAVESGVVVVVSAGNNGPDYQTVTSPGGADGVLTVGASTSGVTVPEIAVTSPIEKNMETSRLAFSANPTEEGVTSELIDLGRGDPKDYDDVDVEGKTVLIGDFSSSNYLDKAIYAEEMGARAAIFYTPLIGGPGPGLGQAFGELDYDDDKYINQHQFDVGTDAYGRLDILVAVKVDTVTAIELQELMNETDETVTLLLNGQSSSDDIPFFSSRGYALDFKAGPDMVAPGVEIASTYPLSLSESGYSRSNGTSMASPHVAGAAALMRQYHGDWTVAQISSALAGTSAKLDVYDPLTQGAGRLDLSAAIKTELTASETSISFGLADLSEETISESQTLSLKNHGDRVKEVDLTVDEGNSDMMVDIEPSTLQLDAGESKEITISIQTDTPEEYMDIMGWVDVRVDNDSASDLRIPYYAAVRPLMMYTSPDPASGGTSNIYIYSPTELEDDPSVSIESPDGNIKEIPVEIDHGNWWEASSDIDGVGIYKVSARAQTQDSITLKGVTYLEKSGNPTDISGDIEWQAIGPNAVSTNITQDPHHMKHLYGPSRDGYFLKKDQNSTWEEIKNLPVAAGSVRELLFDPKDSGQMYIAINGTLSDPTYEGKILRSDDNGETWETLPFPDKEVREFMMADSGEYLIGLTNDEILISYDDGQNWEELHGDWGNHLYDTHLLNDDLYLGTSDGLFVVRDISNGLDSIKNIFTPDEAYTWVRQIVGDENMLLATTFSSGIHASDDNGRTWYTLNADIGGLLQQLDIIDGDIYVSNASKTWVGVNYGTLWNEMDRPVSGTPVTDIIKSPYKVDSLYVKSAGGVFETPNYGNTYNRIGIPGISVYDVEVTGDPGDEQLVAGTSYDTYTRSIPDHKKITASTLEWGMSGYEGALGATTYFLETSPDDPNIVYKVRVAANGQFIIFKSTDAGTTWDAIKTAPGGPQAMMIHPADPDQIYVSYSTSSDTGLLFTKDSGETWDTVSLDNPILTFAGDKENSDRLWVGGGSGVLLSTDGGATFEKIQDIPVNTMAINPENPEHIIFGGRDFYYSYDGGESIEKGEYGPLSIFIRDFVFAPDQSDTIYAAAGSFVESGLVKGGRGVLRSIDGGKTWHSFSNGLNNQNTYSLAITPDAKHLYTGTSGGSVYGIALPLLGDINDDGVIDIYDVMRIIAHYGTSDENADLNNDGIVDEKDVRILETNYLKVTPSAEEGQQPIDTIGGKGIDELLKTIGIEPAE